VHLSPLLRAADFRAKLADDLLSPATKREGAGQPPAEEARFEPTAGAVLEGKYRLDRLLGEGGMGVVVAATHVGLDQRVAIKFLHPEATRNKEAVERFQREAKVAAKVKSEHVTRVHDVGRAQGNVPYIVMEHLEGIDLGDLIDREGRLPVEEACEIVLQACEALAEVHAAGIVHRDLKPSNLFVTRRTDGSPCVKLLDFGISKFTVHPDDTKADPSLTSTATIMGSPSYMSPEQLKSTKEVDARTDVWSLGAVLYEALTGRPAFRGETVPQVCAMIASDDPDPPTSVRGGLPPQLDTAVLGCLAKKPDDRLPLVDLARALVEFAPERARVSLERMEAVLRVPEPTPREEKKQEPLPVLALATERGRTQSSWNHEKRRKRGGGGALLLLALFAGGIFGAGVFTGRINVKLLRGSVAQATSAIATAIPAASQIPSALGIPSSFGINLSDATDAGASEDDDNEDASASPAAPTSTAPHVPAPIHSATKRPAVTVTHPHVSNQHWHKHHQYQ
jgi:serine/threonine protein kinase